MTNPNDLDDFFNEDDGAEDDILDDYVDDESLSEAERERREAAFQREVQKNIRIVMSPKKFKPEQRLDAVRWLGESGELAAIDTLVKVYLKDRRTPGMTDTAAYALGQFKALENALDDPELEEKALNNIEKIVMHDEYGGKANARPFRILQGILTLTLIVLFVGIALALGGGDDSTTIAEATSDSTAEIGATATPDTPEIAGAALQAHYQRVLEDYNRIQAEVDFIKDNGSQSCEAEGTFNQPAAFTLSPAGQSVEALVTAATEIEIVRETVNDIISAYDAACLASSPINNAEALEFDTRLFELEGSLQLIETNLGAVSTSPEATAEAAPPTDMPATPVPTVVEATAEPDVPAEPTAEVTPTEAPDTRDAEFALRSILEDVIGINGVVMSMTTYWQQATTGSDIYCTQPQPIVPERYELDIELIGISPNLDLAVQNINSALDLTRNAVTSFYAACTSGTLQDEAADQLTAVQTAQTLFETAQSNLDAMRR